VIVEEPEPKDISSALDKVSFSIVGNLLVRAASIVALPGAVASMCQRLSSARRHARRDSVASKCNRSRALRS
jgi:hypothetical protein